MKHKIQKAPIALSIAAIVFALAALVTLFIEHQANQDFKKDAAIATTQQNYELSKLTFCYKNKIEQCTDEAISSWNERHADKTFGIKSFEQLVEDGIKAHDAISK